MGLATDTTVFSSRWEGALKVKKMTLTIRASDSSWHPGLPGCPLFPLNPPPDQVTARIRGINKLAEIILTKNAEAPLDKVVGAVYLQRL